MWKYEIALTPLCSALLSSTRTPRLLYFRSVVPNRLGGGQRVALPGEVGSGRLSRALCLSRCLFRQLWGRSRRANPAGDCGSMLFHLLIPSLPSCGEDAAASSASTCCLGPKYWEISFPSLSSFPFPSLHLIFALFHSLCRVCIVVLSVLPSLVSKQPKAPSPTFTALLDDLVSPTELADTE